MPDSLPEYLDEIVRAQKAGEARGIASICSAHPWVLRTAMRGDTTVLIEATCNQVNQFGGYTGMTPADFRSFVRQLAQENNFPSERILLGGDHLGPSPWQRQPAEAALAYAQDLVGDYVRTGFTKIHLDASMRLGDDPADTPLPVELAAARTVRLAQAAEEAAGKVTSRKPRYVIGTEVPIPGGAHAKEAEFHITTVEQARCTLDALQAAFFQAGLQEAWERVIALVVQPGVEFGSDSIREYDPAETASLARFAETIPLVYEAHSTDYQTPQSLQALVRDHFAILKVGPALTFAFREAVFALAKIEAELIPAPQCSRLIELLEMAMQQEPEAWQDHYHGSEMEVALARKFSLSDRIRYYWNKPIIQNALGQLLQNLGDRPLPLSLVSQYFHGSYAAIREGRLKNSPTAFITASIAEVLQQYRQACTPLRLRAETSVDTILE